MARIIHRWRRHWSRRGRWLRLCHHRPDYIQYAYCLCDSTLHPSLHLCYATFDTSESDHFQLSSIDNVLGGRMAYVFGRLDKLCRHFADNSHLDTPCHSICHTCLWCDCYQQSDRLLSDTEYRAISVQHHRSQYHQWHNASSKHTHILPTSLAGKYAASRHVFDSSLVILEILLDPLDNLRISHHDLV